MRHFLLQTVRLIFLSKFPEGKVAMWQVYVAWSDSFVLRINSVESLIASELAKRTRPAKLGNSTHTHIYTKGFRWGQQWIRIFFFWRFVCAHVCVSTLKPLGHVSGDDLLLDTIALFYRPGHLYHRVTVLRFILTRQLSLFFSEGTQRQKRRGLNKLATHTGWSQREDNTQEKCVKHYCIHLRWHKNSVGVGEKQVCVYSLSRSVDRL